MLFSKLQIESLYVNSFGYKSASSFHFLKVHIRLSRSIRKISKRKVSIQIGNILIK